MCIFMYTTITAQVTVSRGILPTNVASCGSITVRYMITSNTNLNQLTIAESFNLNGCVNPITAVNITGYPFGSTSTITTNGFNIILNNVQSGAQYTASVTITFRANPANRRVRICSNALEVTPFPFTNTTITAPPGCITVNNTHSWRSNISCAAVTGTNCRTYTVNVLDSVCGANGFGRPSFRFSVPAGGVITSVTPVTGGITNTGGLNTNIVNFRSNINQWTAGTTNQTFTFTVTYPCNVIPIGNSVTVNFEHIITPFPIPLLNSVFNMRYGPSCGFAPNQPREQIQIARSILTHTLNAPAIRDNLVFNQEPLFDASKNSPGCNSRVRLQYNNTGSTTINTLTIDLPIPPQIQLNSICNQNIPVRRFRVLNNPNWINGTPTAVEMPTVTRLQLGWNPNNVGLPPPAECGQNVNNASFRSIDLCYSIRPNTPIGSLINFNATYNSSDIVNCIAADCPPYVSQTSSGDAIFPIRVIDAIPRPGLNKTMAPSVLFPGEFTTIVLRVRNSGSGALNTTVTDILAAHFDNVSIQSLEYSAAGAAFGPAPAGIITSQNITLDAATQRTTVAVGVEIPGICTLTQTTPGACCAIQFNTVLITIRARVKPCTPAEANLRNTANLSIVPFNNPPGNFNQARYDIQNYNQIQITKQAQGNAASVFSNTLTQVTPGGNLDYNIQVRNTNPQPWTGLVVADLMPRIGDFNLCSNQQPRGSQFDVELTGPVTVTLNNCPGITGQTITYTSNNVNSNILDVCGSGQDINVPTFSVANNKGFQVQFTGSVDCGCEININVPAKVSTTTGLTGGERATNQVIFRTNENSNPAIAEVEAEILTWTLDCCKEGAIKLDKFNVSERVRDPDFNRVAFSYQLSTNSTIPIKEVRMTIIDFDFISDNPECQYCYNKSSSLGVFTWQHGGDNAIEHIGNNPIGSLIVQHQVTDPYHVSRERIWQLGTPINLTTPAAIAGWMNIPLQRNLTCCSGGKISVCFKVEITDVNCNTCEIIKCETFPWTNVRPR